MRLARAVIETLRLAVAREELAREDDAAALAASAHTPGVLHVLFVSREPLGTEPERPAPSRPGFLRMVLGREALPLDPVPAARPRRSRLASFFTLEHLDDDAP